MQCGFLVSQGKNAANPFGLASILTLDERKSACRKHGSDKSFHPIGSLILDKGIHPAYHMNKNHWITVCLDGSVEEEKIMWLVDVSFELTDKPKYKKKKSYSEVQK